MIDCPCSTCETFRSAEEAEQTRAALSSGPVVFHSEIEMAAAVRNLNRLGIHFDLRSAMHDPQLDDPYRVWVITPRASVAPQEQQGDAT